MRGFDWSKRPEITARLLQVYKVRLTKETTAASSIMDDRTAALLCLDN